MAALVEVVTGDDPEAWVRLGFSVSGGARVRLRPVAIRLDGTGSGLRGWRLAGSGPPVVAGIPTEWQAPAPDDDLPAQHPNGALGLDHVVVMTDDRDRTAAALVEAGGDERRRLGPPSVPFAMSFVRMGRALVEVAQGGGPPRLWGLVAVVEDLDACAAGLGELLGPVRDAVQPGRRIATVRPAAGLGAELALMTPRVRA